MKQTAVEWLIEEIECRGIVTKELRLAFEQAKEIESEQHTAIYKEGMANSEGMMNFLYTEVEGRVDALHNSRHKE
jgi:hypothetical protein